MPSLLDRMYGAYLGFREPSLYADPNPGAGHARGAGLGLRSDWGAFDARLLRYRLNWAFYEQNAFRDVQGWPSWLRSNRGLYEGVRDLFGTAHQLGEFWTAHLQGGDLDPLMGDGKTAPSALPILMETEDPGVRGGLAELAKRSNLAIAKDVNSRFGSVLGDCFWEVCDDADGETIRLNVTAAGRVKWCDLSPEGNVLAYELEYWRPDPRRKPYEETKDTPRAPEVKYNEVVTPEPKGGGYRWRTYLDGLLYPWPGNPGPDFTIADLPFAPLVKVQHKNVGLCWGQAESHAGMTGTLEVSDLASCLTDWARKACNAPHLMAGMRNPDDDPQAVARNAAKAPTPVQRRSSFWGSGEFGYGSQSAAESGVRSRMNYLYGPETARAQSLVHPLPVDGVGAQIDRLRAKNLEDYPELSFERIRASGQASAEAIREARKPAEAKVVARRVEHDSGLARAMRMALTYGGLRGYEHYRGFTAADYLDGRLDFRIGPRPAFAPDPAEEVADRQARYTALKAATDAGLPLAMAMREAGYSDQDIKEAVAEQAKQQQQAMDTAKAKGPPQTPGGKP